MKKNVIFVFSTLLLSTLASDDYRPRVTKHYRSDYVYNRDTDAFYKLHIEIRPYGQINRICQVEGAEFMLPTLHKDLIQLHSMFKQYPDLGDYVLVADDGQEHESAEEQPLIDLDSTSARQVYQNRGCLVVTREGQVEEAPCYSRFPFICKVKASDAPYDPRCGAFGKDYKCFNSVNSCYKIPRIAYNWNEAYSECAAEGAHLVVLNSETEREVVQNLTKMEKTLQGTRETWFFHAGFRADQPPSGEETAPTRIFKTVLNQTLEQAGFSSWSENEPNNALGHEYCGSIFKNDGKLNDIDCNDNYAFICEKEMQRS